MMNEWKGFKEGKWCNEINVRDFIQNNYTPYDVDDKFLVGTTDKTKKVWNRCSELLSEELEKHVLDIDVDNMYGINNF